jgi:dTDP-4-amino-4,6-dideoxygalactose transaminase
VIRTEQRDVLREHLVSRGISASIHYPIPIHLQAAYRDLGYQRGDFPVTEAHAQQILSLPMCAELTPELVEYVARSIVTFLSANQNSQGLYE